jgi:hypothetical protein
LGEGGPQHEVVTSRSAAMQQRVDVQQRRRVAETVRGRMAMMAAQ